MTESLVHAVAYLVRDDWRGDELRMRMLQAGPGCGAIIFKDCDLRNARVSADLVIALLVNPKDRGHLIVREQRRRQGVVRRFHDHVVKPNPVDGPLGALNFAGWLSLGR